MEIYYSTYVRD
jgi:hypothetical protein